MADLNKTVSIIFEAQNRAAAALADIQKGLTALETEAGDARTKVQQAGDQIDELGKKGAAVDGVATAMKALAASLVVKAFIDVNTSAETFERTMKLLKGSSEAAAAEFTYITGVAQTLGLNLFTTADAYAQLTAATKGTALEGAGTRDVFEAVAKAMAALGKSSADTQGALLAVSQMISKGTVSAEELRGQLGERLPGAFQTAARSVGVTTAELGKLLEGGKIVAEDFLPKFAAELNRTFGGATFDGYIASLNRLRTEISLSFIDIGKAGAFDLLIAGVNVATATITGAVSVIKLLGETWGNFAFSVNTGDWSGFGTRFSESLDKASRNTKSLIEAMTGAEKATNTVADSGAAAGGAIGDAMGKAAGKTTDLTKASGELDKLLKTLGIDPKIFLDPIEEINKAFTALAANPALDGEKFLAGLVGALRSLPVDANLETLRQQVAYAFRDGKISVDELNQALALLDVKQQGLAPSFGPVTEAAKTQAEELKKTAEAAKKAEEGARQYALEMEKIASNERIKRIEAKVSIDVAQLEADTARVVAAFESIGKTIDSTGDLLGGLFKLFEGYDQLSFSAIRAIEKQIELENDRRKEALDIQKRLTEAQIEQLRARTKALDRSDAIIKVDGAGLQPHLEAFMWEILRTIQTRVNQDGLEMLLGV